MVDVHPPVAERRDHVRTLHGDEFHDAYEWMRDKSSPDTIAYLEAENAYTEAVTGHLTELTEDIFTEIKNRTQETDLSVARFSTDAQGRSWWYYSRTQEGKDYALMCRCPARSRDQRPDPSAPIEDEQVILDGNLEAEGKEFFSLGGAAVSPNGNLFAWLVDNAGDERFALYVKDLVTGEVFGPTHTDLAGGIDWAGDGHLVYTRVDEAWRPHQAWCHTLQTDPSADVLLYQEDDETYWMGISGSNDNRFLIIQVASKNTSECWLVDTSDPTATPRCVTPRRAGIDYSVEPAGDRLLIVHNDGALDYQLSEAPLKCTSAEQWHLVLPGQEGVRMGWVDTYRDFVVVGIRRNALTGLHVIPRDGHGDLGTGRDITFDEPVYTIGYAGDDDYDTDRIMFPFTSLLTPQCVYEYVVATGESTLLKQTPVLDDPIHGPFDPAAYVQKREWATALDGTRIPLSIVHRKDVVLDGNNPFYLYGYGSYEVSIDPSFSISRLALLERGVVFAIAHIRGGGEMGRGWYDQGKTTTKRNTFTDFLDCARHVIQTGYTSAGRIGIEGRSAGGLLMGAVLNMAEPGLIRCAHAGVPFVDALTSMTMPELPLTAGEWEEWGNPITDPEVYAYMRSYSPYENVQPREYPSILVTTSLNDTRVLCVEPAKWVAQLRHTATFPADGQLVMKCEMVAGHGGASGRYSKWRNMAFEYAWMLDQLGVPL